MPATTSEPPDFFTIEEAARVLRIGRTAAYELARKWRETEGREGLPVVAFGRLLRVPRAALEGLSGGSITTPRARAPKAAPAGGPEPVAEAPVVARVELTRPSHRRHRRTRATPPDQTTLPFE
jgi:excisionase family DNA binding protein